MLNRHISLTLALRYLNPLRTYFSIITLICLIGVSLGVMVLIVVLSVMGGLQKEIQGRLLAFSPHIQVNSCFVDPNDPKKMQRTTLHDWMALTELLSTVPEIESSYALIEDNALIDAQGMRRPSFFRAIDTENQQQLNELRGLIREGSFDLDMGEKVVVSSLIADPLGLSVGDNLGVLTLRNLEDISHAYTQVERDMLVNRFPDLFKLLNTFINKGQSGDNVETWKKTEVEESLELLNRLSVEPAREGELALLTTLSEILITPQTEDEAAKTYLYDKGTKDNLAGTLQQLITLNKDQEDLNSFRQIKDLVLPKDMEVIGIYQASEHVLSPELFIPLNIGQELLGYEDDSVQAIAVRVKDPYQLGKVMDQINMVLPQSEGITQWVLETWQDKYSNFYSLMQRERSMMNFVLSFISLISAFCIMAVMFTVSIQRKKELAVIKALGATPGQIIRVFLWQGVIIGIAGALLGVAMGLLVLHYRIPIHTFLAGVGFDPFPMNFHGVEIPAEINTTELMIQSLKAFFMVVIASVVPAIFTAYQDPAKALRSL